MKSRVASLPFLSPAGAKDTSENIASKGGKEVQSANRNGLDLLARPIATGAHPHFVQLLLIRLGHRTLRRWPDRAHACSFQAGRREVYFRRLQIDSRGQFVLGEFALWK